jgi:hypothetical protein
MGKRELVLIIVFAFLGIILYQVTAPPSEGPGFSLRGTLESLRRHVGPRHEYLAEDRTQSFPAGRDLSEVRVADAFQVKAIGTDDPAIVVRAQIYSTGTNEDVAKALAKRTQMKPQLAGDILSIGMAYPPEERQRTTFEIRLPRRLKLRASNTRLLDVRDLAGLELDDTRGETVVSNVTGPVQGSQTTGSLTINDAGGMNITGRRVDLTANRITGAVRLDLTAGAFHGRDVHGPADIDANRVSIELERYTGRLSADLTQGDFSASGLSEPFRIDARGTSLRLEFDKTVAGTAVTSDETIDVRLPASGGVTLDIDVDDGDIRLPSGAPQPTAVDRAKHVSGAFRGGGPTLSLRTSHGDVVIR